MLTDENGEKRASGSLGCFATSRHAEQFAIAFGKFEVERRHLATLSR